MIQTKLYPWHVAQARKIAVTHLTLGMLWSTTYLTILTSLLFPGDPREDK